MRKVSYIFLLALLLAACGGWRDGDRLLSEADGLLYSHPDSAQRLLDSIPDGDLARMSQAQRMRYELLRADAQNKRYVKFTTDSVLKEVVEYYDRKGTANERMRANYLLGRAYYDMGETPMALKYYHEAADQADTTQADCDMRILGRVHGQMARLLLQQDALLSAKDEFYKSYLFFRRCGDTLSYLAVQNQLSNIYDKLGWPDSAIANSKRVSSLFMAYGNKALSAIAMGSAIEVMIRQGKLEEARDAMNKYESESGIFDGNHRIKKGKEIYLYTKSLYFLYTGHIDSAIYYSQELLRNARTLNHLECGYSGLAKAYSHTSHTDSATKYALLAYEFNDSCHREKLTENYQRYLSFYNYSRQQQLAEQHAKEAAETRFYGQLSFFILTAILCIVLFLLWRKRQEAQSIRLMLDSAYSDLNTLQADYERLFSHEKETLTHVCPINENPSNNPSENNTDAMNLRQQFEKAYAVLKEEKEFQIYILETRLGCRPEASVNSKISQLPIIMELKQQADRYGVAMKPEQWTKLKESIDALCPKLSLLIEKNYPGITPFEQKIVYLTRSLFKSGQAMTLMESSGKSAFAMKKNRLLLKLFGVKDGGAILFNHLIENLE